MAPKPALERQDAQVQSYWLARSVRTILFLAFALTAAGVYAFFRTPISVFPETNFPRIVIGVDNGVMPVEQMQVTITKPIEDAVNSVPGLLTVRSTTSRGSADVSLFFDWSVDMFRTLALVDAALSQAQQSLPATAKITTNRLTFATFPILGYSVTSTTLSQSELWELATYTLKPPLNRVIGVSTVTIQGGRRSRVPRGSEHGADAGCGRHDSGPCERDPDSQHRRFAGALRTGSSAGACAGGRAGT